MIKRILLPVDGSPFSERAASYGIFLSKSLGAEISLIHILKVAPAAKLDPEEIKRKKIQQAEICFSSIISKAEKEGLRIDTKILASRKIPQTILNEASDNEYDLIIIGSHGLSGFRKLILGSVTEEILKKSTIPVLVVS